MGSVASGINPVRTSNYTPYQPTRDTYQGVTTQSYANTHGSGLIGNSVTGPY